MTQPRTNKDCPSRRRRRARRAAIRQQLKEAEEATARNNEAKVVAADEPLDVAVEKTTTSDEIAIENKNENTEEVQSEPEKVETAAEVTNEANNTEEIASLAISVAVTQEVDTKEVSDEVCADEIYNHQDQNIDNPVVLSMLLLCIWVLLILHLCRMTLAHYRNLFIVRNILRVTLTI